MKVWLVKSGEPIPIDRPNAFISRMGMIAKRFASRGHDVTWWTSTFEHHSKANLFDADCTLQLSEGLTIRAVWVPIGYKQNISLARIVHQYLLGKRFVSSFEGLPKPDLILCSFPSIEVSAMVSNWAKSNQIPVIIDARDMWPDTYLDVFPRQLRPLISVLIRPFQRITRQVFQNARAVYGITDSFVDWALRYASRVRTCEDHAFYLAYDSGTVLPADKVVARRKWHSLGLKSDQINIVFYGTFSRIKLNLEPVLEAIKRLKVPVTVVLCGEGDDRKYYAQYCADMPNVIFTNWISKAEAEVLLEFATIGLAPYNNKADYQASIPTKIVEYLASGVPILTGLRGEVEALIQREACGFFYADQSVESLAEFLTQLVANPDQIKAASVRATDVFNRQFTADAVYGGMAAHTETLGAHLND